MGIESTAHQVQLLKENWKLNHFQALFFGLTGLVSLWFGPFVSSSPGEKAMNVLYGLFSGSMVLFSQKSLTRLAPFMNAIAIYEEKQFTHCLGADLFLNNETIDEQVKQLLFEQPDTGSAVDLKPLEASVQSNTLDPELEQLQLNLASELNLNVATVQDVLIALIQQKSKSFIIKSILKMPGVKYPQGKSLLAKIEQGLEAHN